MENTSQQRFLTEEQKKELRMKRFGDNFSNINNKV
jgi:hypothetical protein